MTSGRAERTPEAEDEFLAAVETTGSVTAACKLVGLGRRTVYEWKEADPVFAARMEAAQDRGTDALEDEAVRRAVEGVDEPVFYQGAVAGYVRRYSDTLLMFTLKGRRPDKWKDRSAQEISGPGGEPLVQIYLPSNGRDVPKIEK